MLEGRKKQLNRLQMAYRCVERSSVDLKCAFVCVVCRASGAKRICELSEAIY